MFLQLLYYPGHYDLGRSKNFKCIAVVRGSVAIVFYGNMLRRNHATVPTIPWNCKCGVGLSYMMKQKNGIFVQ